MAALMCQEAGAAVAVRLFPSVGPIGMVALRLLLSALLLWPVARPAVRGLPAGSFRTVIGYGLVLAGMNASFYLALERLALGVAVTIEVLGPLTLSVIAGRSRLGVLWAALAVTGVVLLAGDPGTIDPLGVLFALMAAVLWALYILTSQRTGAAFLACPG